MIAMRKILVPTDFGALSKLALRYAKELARNFNAELHVLHVVQDAPGFTWTLPRDALGSGFTFTEKTPTKVHVELEKVMTDAEREEVHARPAIRRGTPFAEIVRYARANDIDVIVIGTPDRGVLAHMLTGPSVAEKVVRKAPCPVLTVRDSEHEFVMA
jgi:nucleotide-binding universal stress UspA family protein